MPNHRDDPTAQTPDGAPGRLTTIAGAAAGLALVAALLPTVLTPLPAPQLALHEPVVARTPVVGPEAARP